MTLKDKFTQLKSENKKAFIAYIPYGFPKIRYTKDLILTLQDAGVDIIELGIPFSDPLADGVIIQQATSHALAKGANIENFFSTISDLKSKLKLPLVIMTYYNPVFRYGMERFFKRMKDVEVSGIMIVDLPIEESREYIKASRDYNLETVFFVTPTTSEERAEKIVSVSKGFIYYISVTGITGPKNLPYKNLASSISNLKKNSNLPICVGFGIHTKEQVVQINNICDGVIVGSSIVKFIADNYLQKDFWEIFKQYVRALKEPRSVVGVKYG